MGVAPEALMSRSGHSSYAITRRYIDLAGLRFREEANQMEDRLWGESGPRTGSGFLRRIGGSPATAYLSGEGGI